MVQKCKNCGEPIVRFPLKDSMGNFLWKNLFKMSWDSILLIVIIAAMVIAYKQDTATCFEIIEDPVRYCEESNACRILINEQVNTQFVDPAGINIFDEELIKDSSE